MYRTFTLFLVPLVFLLTMVGPVQAEIPPLEVGISFNYWYPNFDATSRAGGGEVDFKDHLGGENKNLSGIQLNIGIKGVGQGDSDKRVRFDYDELRYKNEKSLTQDIFFAGQTYPNGTETAYKVRMRYVKLGYLAPISKKEDKWQVKGVLEIKGSQVDYTFAPPERTKSYVLWLPTVGLRASTMIDNSTEFFAECSGIPEGKYGSYLDGELGLKKQVNDKVTISGGYRLVKITAKQDDDYSKVTFQGPYASLKWKF